MSWVPALGLPSPAFTRVELLVLLGILAVLVAVTLPGLARTRPLSEQVVCVNNLRQIGLAMHLWINDHGNQFHWRTCVKEGGTRIHSSCPLSYPAPWWAGLQHNSWFQFYWLSNELSTPAILACPSDATVKPALDWSTSFPGGFASPTFRNNSVSYSLGLDSFPDNPLSLVAVDRNMSSNTISASCSSGVTWTAAIYLTLPEPNVAWTPGVHDHAGNMLLSDGLVRTATTAGLRRALHEGTAALSDNGVMHFLYPR